MKVIGFVIHLRRAKERLKTAENLADQCGVPCSLLDAVDGSKLPQSERDHIYKPSLVTPHYPFPLGPGEIGCFLSHRNAWKELITSDADAALILEDDMQIASDFPDALKLAVRHADKHGYIQFQTRPVAGEHLDTLGDVKLYLPNITPLRTSGQLVSRAAAEKLLHLTEQFDRPVDTFLQMHWHTGIHLASLAPSGLVDVASESTISGKKPLMEKLTREFRRGRYRRTVTRLSNRNLQQ